MTIFCVLLFMTQLICRINAISIYIYLDIVTYGSFLVPNEKSNILSRQRLYIKYDIFIDKVMYLRFTASLYLKIAVYVCETAQWRIQRGWGSGGSLEPPPRPRFLISYENEISWSVSSNYFMFMEIFKESEIKSAKRTLTPLNLYIRLPFQKSWIRPYSYWSIH